MLPYLPVHKPGKSAIVSNAIVKKKWFHVTEVKQLVENKCFLKVKRSILVKAVHGGFLYPLNNLYSTLLLQ